jgi:hypothetical protein
MKYILIIITLILVSCEETVDNAELDYENQLVIQGFITANSPLHIAQISKTVPPLDEPTTQAVEVKDSIGKVIYNGEEFYYTKQCPPNVACLEFILDSIKPMPGDQIYFEAQGDGKKATATVNIPKELPMNPKFYYKTSKSIFEWSQDSTLEIFVEFDTSSDYVYKVNRDVFISFTDFFIGTNSRAKYLIQQIDFNDNEELERELEVFQENLIQIQVYELAMKVYDDTRYQGDGFDGLFSGSGLNVEGNIEGGIGILAGRLINFIEVEEIIETK